MSTRHAMGWRAQWLAAVIMLLPAAAAAQTGRVTGTVSDQSGEPVRGAQVVVVGTRLGSLTGANGAFTIAAVPAGTHRIRIVHIGYGERTVDATVRASEDTRVDVALEAAAVSIAGLVVSASRRTERVTEAPATVTRIEPRVIDNSIGNSFAHVLKEVKGIDFIQVGVNSVGINARGFNSSFNNRMLMMEDGRVSVLPESGLPVGSFTATPKVDLASVEVLVGPGAALYGADASSGVLYTQTKDPRQYPGTTVELTGGKRNYADIQFRHAGATEKWGYKVAGEYLTVEDWSNVLSYTITGVQPGNRTVVMAEDQMKLPINWDSKVTRGIGAVNYYSGESTFQVTGGMSESDGVGQTNVGRNQFTDWRYNFFQAKFTSPRWYLTAYRTQSQSGESFALNRYADAQARSPNLSADSLRKLSDWPSNGRLYAAELQHNFELAPLLGTQVTWGGQFRQDVVSSERQWLSDRLTGEDITIKQMGAYAQTKTPLHRMFDLVLAARVDDHENYDTQISPKAGLLFKPVEDQTIRLTYNRAFKSPTILQTNFHIPDWTAVIGIFGNTKGYEVRFADGSVKTTYAALEPEENTTWELGYKGVLKNRLFIDVTGFWSDYTNFISPLVIINDPFGLRLAGDAAGVKSFAYSEGQLVKHAAGYSPITLIYYNLGKAKLRGTDAGLNYLVSQNVELKGTLSLVDLESVEVPAGREEATALNAPDTKWTLGAAFHDIGNFSGNTTVRYVGEYYFRSGINRGVIPQFTTVDAGVTYKLPWRTAMLSLSLNNLFACGGDFTYNPAANPNLDKPTGKTRSCGFGEKHAEMINMPKVGTMVYVGVKYQR